MNRSPLIADLHRAMDLLHQIDEGSLDFAPDPAVSKDVQDITGLESYPVDSHRSNLQARIDAVVDAGDRLNPRQPSDYVSRLIVACVQLAPPSDD